MSQNGDAAEKPEKPTEGPTTKQPELLTPEAIKELLQAQLDAVNEPFASERLRKLHEDSKNEAINIMVNYYPQLVALQTAVLEQHGYHGTQGLIQFFNATKQLMQSDTQIEDLYNELQRISYLEPRTNDKAS